MWIGGALGTVLAHRENLRENLSPLRFSPPVEKRTYLGFNTSTKSNAIRILIKKHLFRAMIAKKNFKSAKIFTEVEGNVLHNISGLVAVLV